MGKADAVGKVVVGVAVSEVVLHAASLTDTICVGVSGKDSLVTLDLCCKHFERVKAFFMYLVPDLAFQERYLDYLERRYQIQIVRLPHWMLGTMFGETVFRFDSDQSLNAPRLKITDIENTLRARLEVDWFAYGIKATDSLERRGMLSEGGSVNEKTKRVYPVAWFNDKAIYLYLKMQRIPLPPDYRMFGRSFSALNATQLIPIRDQYPDDYRKILEVFPFAEAEVKRVEFATQPL